MIRLAIAISMLFQSAIAQFAPEPALRLLDWSCRYMQNESGRPYAHGEYPHLGAPGGPCDAHDDETVREIALQFASRLGKTFFGQCAMLKEADTRPAPAMFVSSTEKVATEVVDRTYTLLERNPRLKHRLLRENLRKGDRIDLGSSLVFVGWAKSVSTLADKNVKNGHGNELDKWERVKTSTEGDPLDLFRDRSKDFPNYKYIFESTPSVRGVSRIEQLLLAGSNCRLYVPCPHCQQYQVLRFERVFWQRTESGGHNTELAERTAHYLCEHCEGQILDHHRHGMMRLGVWAPSGCGVDSALALSTAQARLEQLAAGTFSLTHAGHYLSQPYLSGAPSTDGKLASYQLSSLYALKLSWGRIAAEWVNVYKTPARLWNFKNQWLGETWEVKKRTEDWRAVAGRLIVGIPRAVVPIWASMLTMGVDRQMDHYKWLVDAWGPGARNHVVDYGRATSLEVIYQQLILKLWPYEDRGTLTIGGTLVDCGYEPKEPCELSKKCLADSPRRVVLVCRGSSSKLYAPYQISTMGPRTAMPGLPNVLVDGDWTQTEIDRQLYELRPGQEGALSIYYGALEDHEPFIKELVNEQPQVKLDKANHESVSWTRADEEHPNDHRDCKRYSYVAHLIRRGGLAAAVRERVIKVDPKRAPPRPRMTMPDGRSYLPR